jgi:hypothetical protein
MPSASLERICSASADFPTRTQNGWQARRAWQRGLRRYCRSRPQEVQPPMIGSDEGGVSQLGLELIEVRRLPPRDIAQHWSLLDRPLPIVIPRGRHATASCSPCASDAQSPDTGEFLLA